MGWFMRFIITQSLLAFRIQMGNILSVTWANGLTLLRVGLVGPLVWAVLSHRWTLGLGLFLGGVATDILDGWVARREKPTLLGQFLDPLADKVFYFTLAVAFHVVGRLPLLAVVLTLIPQLGIGLGAVVLWPRRRELRARWTGKAAAALTALASGLLFLTPHGLEVYWAAVAAQFVAGLYYLIQQAMRRTPEEAGPEIPASRPH